MSVMKGSSQSSRPPVVKRVRVERFVDYNHSDNEALSDFNSRVGRAINGAGNTKSLGSMSLSLLTAEDFSWVRNKLTTTDRNRLNARIDDFADGLEEKLGGERSEHQQLVIAGLGLWGRRGRNKRRDNISKLGFSVVPKKCPELEQDIDDIKSYFSDHDLEEPPININRMHLTFGEVDWQRISRGQNKRDPHTLIPAGLVVPSVIEMGDLHVEVIQSR